MQNKSVSLQKQMLIYGIPLFLILTVFFVTKTAVFSLNASTLSIGILLDLLLIIPVIYFLLIRKTTISKTTVMLFIILGMLIATISIPIEHQYYLQIFKKWIFPFIEITVISIVFYKVKIAIRSIKNERQLGLDFFDILLKISKEMLPKKMVIPVATEIAVFYYGFIFWKKRTIKRNEFTYHKNSGIITILIALLFIIGIETYAFHALLIKWNIVIAWSFTFLSIYSAIQIIGFLKSMIKRPFFLGDTTLKLCYGILSVAEIDIDNIEKIEIRTTDIELSDTIKKLSPFGELESHNIVLTLKKESVLTSLYGFTKKFKTLVFYVDNKNEFKEKVEEKLFEINKSSK